ncbi:hypothetical protein T12_8249 [Trichinella patagoniensis]|uniref:Uncharacterized protein n=1 Tax=Trichinella patagoniensis TaxID=990121 RepID=A0A0V0ZWN2_9BILA|nr:hypothetical protein T12_8249 [Trichinella patagoniensis]
MANGSDPILSCSLNNNELMQCLNQLQIADSYSTNSTFRTEVFLNRLFMRGGLRSYLKQKAVRFQHRYSPYHVPLRNEQCELLEDLHGKQVFDRIKAHVASEFQKIHILGPKKYDMNWWPATLRLLEGIEIDSICFSKQVKIAMEEYPHGFYSPTKCSSEARTIEPLNAFELAAYVEEYLYFPKKMCAMARNMYV